MGTLIRYTFFIIFGILISSCDYLDVVPDNVATLDNAFTSRNEAEKYLFTCYRYLPKHAEMGQNPAWLSGDEFVLRQELFSESQMAIATGNQNVVSPSYNYWDGKSYPFRGIRDCNIFLENIEKVPDINQSEKRRWIAEVKFLKAYYHFWLFRMYGPIPLIRENLPISASPEDVRIKREPVDICVDYIVELLNEATENLPDVIFNDLTELGRITKPVALSTKALVLVTAASPLFNGNTEYNGFTDKDGVTLFNTNYQEEKWERAAVACHEAIETCHSNGLALYYFQPSGFGIGELSQETIIQMNIRNSVCEKWNPEIIWGNTNSIALEVQRNSTPSGLNPALGTQNGYTRGNMVPVLKITEMFYSKNGVPISEDKNYNYSDKYNLRVATEEDKYHLQPGYTTVGLNFDREQRYYASLGFDGGLWYGQGQLDDDNQWKIQAKLKQNQGKSDKERYSVTGLWAKKLVNYQNIIGTGSSYTIERYPWPVMRLADLYLLYAEALNEAEGPSSDALTWINLVRERAGLLTVEESWAQHSIYPDKYTTKEGLREIIQQERLIELAFEGKRFWDLRRWKRAHIELNKPIQGWDITQEEASAYYRPKTLFHQTFLMRDYLWPIRESNLDVNPNLVQNPGW